MGSFAYRGLCRFIHGLSVMNEFIVACVGEGAYVTTANGRPRCHNGTWSQLSYQDVVTSFDLTLLPPEQILQHFAAGMFLYIIFWSVGKGIKTAISLFK